MNGFDPANTCPNCFRPHKGGGSCPACGFAPEPGTRPANSLPISTLVAKRYCCGRVLGAGGFGITYAAWDTQRQQRCAIKEYFPASMAVRDPNTLQVSAQARFKEFQDGLESFYNEASILHQLQNWPSIVRILDFARGNGTAYMVMEYIEGENLKIAMRKNGGRLPYHTAYQCLLETALGLTEVHAGGVLHRDVSPENILLLPNGQTKLVDFGASRLALKADPADRVIMLKPGFAPPEQYTADGKQGPWTDEYGLACTFYRIATGQPLPDVPARRNGQQVQPLYTLVPEAPHHVSAAIERAMALDIDARFPSMNAFINALTEGNITDSVSAPQGTEASPPIERTLRERFQHWKGRLLLPVVTVVSGTGIGSSVTLEDGKPVHIGRMSQVCELVPDNDKSISRVHCILSYDKQTQAVLVQDVSSNGTVLEGGIHLRKGDSFYLKDTTDMYLAGSGCVIRVVFKT